ncbi:MAG TPA: peroxiredoxin-like family protein [Herpetosiphonaceae bacterium]|nr:peroxiredoxin-like family protein [Herpetosiphonaceae bacterium]
MSCREHLAQLREHEQELDRLGAVVLGVSFEEPSVIARFAERESLPYPILSDPERTAYRAFGLERGGTAQVWSPNALRTYARGLLRGKLPRLPRADIAQLGGDFVLDAQGSVVYEHRSEESADRPAIDRLLDAVRAVANRP